MKKENVNNDFSKMSKGQHNSLSSGIRINGVENSINNEKRHTMILKNLGCDWRKNTTFSYKVGLVEYQCEVEYLPFCKDKNVYETKELTGIYTPVFHLGFEALNTKESIYQSHWIMSGSLLWFLNEYPDSTLSEMVEIAAQENGFLTRISEANRKQQNGIQLSIF